uniref:Uncharacterized protein n=1 Tax=Anguilla anguilla TaxID=7936 RepID=A0A0E9QK74_ANGAN
MIHLVCVVVQLPVHLLGI